MVLYVSTNRFVLRTESTASATAVQRRDEASRTRNQGLGSGVASRGPPEPTPRRFPRLSRRGYAGIERVPDVQGSSGHGIEFGEPHARTDRGSVLPAYRGPQTRPYPRTVRYRGAVIFVRCISGAPFVTMLMACSLANAPSVSDASGRYRTREWSRTSANAVATRRPVSPSWPFSRALPRNSRPAVRPRSVPLRETRRNGRGTSERRKTGRLRRGRTTPRVRPPNVVRTPTACRPSRRAACR